ncbi:MAG: helix-turn-helix domain-containing protein [Myxococcales bacterium]|nr:helix-turn-helix domain-containing protein [Myxococcales bacterium]
MPTPVFTKKVTQKLPEIDFRNWPKGHGFDKSGVGLLLIAVADAARLLGVSSATVYRLCASGELKNSRIGNSIRIQRDGLEAFLKATPTCGPR